MSAEIGELRKRLEIWMRGHIRQGVHERQPLILSELRQFEANRKIAELTVHTWETCVTIADSDADPSASVPGKISEFEVWAEQNGPSPAILRATRGVLNVHRRAAKQLVLSIICLDILDR